MRFLILCFVFLFTGCSAPWTGPDIELSMYKQCRKMPMCWYSNNGVLTIHGRRASAYWNNRLGFTAFKNCDGEGIKVEYKSMRNFKKDTIGKYVYHPDKDQCIVDHWILIDPSISNGVAAEVMKHEMGHALGLQHTPCLHLMCSGASGRNGTGEALDEEIDAVKERYSE